MGVLLPPREQEGQAVLLQGPQDSGHPTFHSESVESQQTLVACYGKNSGSPFVVLRHWLGDIYREVTVAPALVRSI